MPKNVSINKNEIYLKYTQWLSRAVVVSIILPFFRVSELSRLKDEEISAAAIKAQFEKQLLTERTLKTQVRRINSECYL